MSKKTRCKALICKVPVRATPPTMNDRPPPLILASTSVYRRGLLERLGLRFEAASPAVDETPLAEETPDRLSARLALAKARAVAERHPGAVVIGSDQVATIPDGRILGKPGTVERAVEQIGRAHV